MAKRKYGMKASKETRKTKRGRTAPEEPQILPAVPERLLVYLAIVSLALPNIIFSGTYWFQTLHLMKWVVAMTPVAVMALVGGYRLIRYGPGRVGFRLEGFGFIWFILLLYITVQPFWADLTSIPTFIREWFFFASMLGLYLFCRSADRQVWKTWLKWILLFAGLNAATNMVFAELQARDMVSGIPFIAQTPGHYIGNTGQKNMFGLWCAISLLGLFYLWLAETFKETGKRSLHVAHWLAIGLMPMIIWALLNTGSRSSILAFIGGIVMLVVGLWRAGQMWHPRKVMSLLVLLLVVLGGIVVTGHGMGKFKGFLEMVSDPGRIGGRNGIWATSWTMFAEQPWEGVGLGHFKLNYLEAQRKMFDRFDGMKWQFTNWAHNEYLQWFCEAGVVGGMILVGLVLWWLISYFRALLRRQALSLEAIYGNALLSMIWFDALWTRPFHRIEDALWLSFGFALANPELLRTPRRLAELLRRPLLNRTMGVVMVASALIGLVLLGQGMVADRKLAVAVRTREASTQRGLIKESSEALLFRDNAERQMAYHYIALGQAAENEKILKSGVARLDAYFRKRPHSRELRRLMKYYGMLGAKDRLQELTDYLKPGSYTIRRKPKDSSGPDGS